VTTAPRLWWRPPGMSTRATITSPATPWARP